MSERPNMNDAIVVNCLIVLTASAVRDKASDDGYVATMVKALPGMSQARGMPRIYQAAKLYAVARESKQIDRTRARWEVESALEQLAAFRIADALSALEKQAASLQGAA